MGLLFREHPKAQPEGGFRRSPGSNLRPLVYKASDLTTAPRRLLTGHFFFLGETSTVGGCFCGFVVPGAPEGSTVRRFLEKPGIEPATSGLQGG